MAKLAFIGLGVMGFPMAGHLARAGHQVRVFNRSRNKAERWCASFGGKPADTPAAAAGGADMVMTCVGNDDDVRSVVLGAQGAFAGMSPGAVLIDHTTASAALAGELSGLAVEQGFAFLDAPVSGGQAGADNGQLSIMVGGEQDTFSRSEKVLKVYAKSVRLMGPVGNGQLTKMVNQICQGGLLQALSEALIFAEQAGLDTEAVVDVISRGASQSWQLENRAGTMLAREFDFGFAVDWLRKDLGMVFDEARRLGVSLPVTALVDQFYADVQAMGGGRWDTSSLIRRMDLQRGKGDEG